MSTCIEITRKGHRCRATDKYGGYCAAHFAPIAREHIVVLRHNLLMVAKLSKGGQFFNPLIVFEAKTIRDRVLETNQL